jgi:hypothetical protein
MAVANRKIKFSGKTFVTPTSGGGGGGSSLRVEEQDGVPSVSPVNTIRVTNGTLTDEGGGVVSIVTGGGTTVSQSFGEIVQPSGGSTIGLTTTYTGWNTGAVGQLSGMTFSSGAGTDPDTLSPDDDGTFQAIVTFSIASGSANRDVVAAFSVNGTVDTDTEVTRSFVSAGSSGSFSSTKLFNLTAGDEVGVELKVAASTDTITVDNISFNLTSIGTGGSGGGGTPAAPNESVQFNNGGAFGGSSEFIYDITNLRVGIGNSTPARKLHVEEITTQLRLAYDATGYVDIYADAGGDLQIIPEGGAVYQNADAVNSYSRQGSYVLAVTTATATPAAMTLSPGSGALTLTTNTNWFFDGLFVGKQDASSNTITVKLEGVVQRQGGSASILGAVFKFVVHDDSAGAWDVNAGVSGNNLVITVTGAAGTDIDWIGHLRTAEVQD